MLWKNYFGIQKLYYFDKTTSTFLFIWFDMLFFSPLLHSALEQTQGWEKLCQRRLIPMLTRFTTLGHQLKNWGWVWSPGAQNMGHATSWGTDFIHEDSELGACTWESGSCTAEWEVEGLRDAQLLGGSLPVWLSSLLMGRHLEFMILEWLGGSNTNSVWVLISQRTFSLLGGVLLTYEVK